MTRVTANIILLIMAGVWAYLSVKEGLIQPVSENFLYIGLLVAGGELASAADLPGMLNKKNADRMVVDRQPRYEAPGERPAPSPKGPPPPAMEVEKL